MKRLLIAILLFSFLTLSAANLSSASSEIQARTELHCLALNIHFEAGGEPIRGRIAVGQVTLNRLRHRAFPDTICGVVMQPFQFSWVKRIRSWHLLSVPSATLDLAQEIINGKYKDESMGALYFHAKEVEPFNRREVLRIGNHIFYK